MSQVIDSVSSVCASSILCCYVNVSSKIQIARITNVPEWYFERVVFPGQRLIFEAPPAAQLEIHCGMMASAILSDTIPCDRLRIEGDEVAPFGVSADSAEASTQSEDNEVTESSLDPLQQQKVRSFVATPSIAS